MPYKLKEGADKLVNATGAHIGLSEGVPAEIPSVEPDPIPEPADGDFKFKPGDERTRAIAVAGGKARAEQRRQLKSLSGLGTRDEIAYAESESMKPYLKDALEFVEHEMLRLAEEVGGGWTPPSAVAMLQTAGRMLAREAWLFDRGHFFDAFNVAEKKNKALAAAHEYTAKSATSRKNMKKETGATALREQIKSLKK